MSFLWSYWADSNRRPADYERKIDTFLYLY